MVQVNGKLYIVNVPAGAKRGVVYLISSHETIPGTSDRTRVGLVRGLYMHESSLEVVELCPIPARQRGVLAKDGLPAMPLEEDKRARVGKCLANYQIGPDAWDSSRVGVDLRLDLGSGDGVKEGDRYEILGEAIVDRVNQTVTGFELLGSCAVQGPVREGYSRCRLDTRQWRSFTRDQALTGGYAVFETKGR